MRKGEIKVTVLIFEKKQNYALYKKKQPIRKAARNKGLDAF